MYILSPIRRLWQLTDGVTHQTACKCTYFHLYEGSDSLTDGVTQQTAYTFTCFHISGKSASPEPDTRCNRDATRQMHTKKLPVVLPPPLPNSNINCQTDQAILFPTFYLNSVSIYGLRKTLILLSHAATVAKHTHYNNDTGAFQERFFFTVWAFRAFKMARAA